MPARLARRKGIRILDEFIFCCTHRSGCPSASAFTLFQTNAAGHVVIISSRCLDAPSEVEKLIWNSAAELVHQSPGAECRSINMLFFVRSVVDIGSKTSMVTELLARSSELEPMKLTFNA